jgi:hypothetical protein
LDLKILVVGGGVVGVLVVLVVGMGRLKRTG